MFGRGLWSERLESHFPIPSSLNFPISRSIRHLTNIVLTRCSLNLDLVRYLTRNKESWFSSKSVVRLDMLFGKCGKSGLVALHLDFALVVSSVKECLGKELKRISGLGLIKDDSDKNSTHLLACYFPNQVAPKPNTLVQEMRWEVVGYQSGIQYKHIPSPPACSTGSSLLLLAIGAFVNLIAFVVTRRRYFLYLAVAIHCFCWSIFRILPDTFQKEIQHQGTPVPIDLVETMRHLMKLWI